RGDRSAGAYILRFEDGKAFSYLRSDATKAYGGDLEEYWREVIYVRPDIFIIHDYARAPKPSEFEVRVHSLGDFEFDPDGRLSLQRERAALTGRMVSREPADLQEFDQYAEEYPLSTAVVPVIPTHRLVLKNSSKVRENDFVSVYIPREAASSEPQPEVDVTFNEDATVVTIQQVDRTTRAI